MMRENKSYNFINFFVSFLKRNSSLYQLHFFNFWISMKTGIKSYIEEILLNLTTCPYTLDL